MPCVSFRSVLALSFFGGTLLLGCQLLVIGWPQNGACKGKGNYVIRSLQDSWNVGELAKEYCFRWSHAHNTGNVSHPQTVAHPCWPIFWNYLQLSSLSQEFGHSNLTFFADYPAVPSPDVRLLNEVLWKDLPDPIRWTSQRSCNREGVRVAFVLLLNEKGFKGEPDFAVTMQLLISLASQPNHFILVHLDADATLKRREDLRALLRTFSNAKFTSFSLKVEWGGKNLVLIYLLAIQELLTSAWCFDFVINLSGSDFPAMTYRKMHAMLASQKGTNFISFDLGPRKWFPFVLSDCYNFPMWVVRCVAGPSVNLADAPQRLRQLEAKVGHRITVFRGSQWNILSRDFAHYTVQSSLLRWWWLALFHFGDIPDESFFQTVIWYSSWNATLVTRNLRFIKNSSRRIIFNSDLGNIRRSGALFARKFVEASVVDEMQQMLKE